MPSLQRKTNRLYDTIRRMSKKRLALLISLSVLVIVFGIVGGIVISAIAACPAFDPKQLTQTDQTSFVYDNAGKEIGKLHLKEDRESVEANQIPDIVKKSFVGVEDIRFYDHHGVDPIGIARALVHTITGGQREGGSTITVQLARGAFLSPDQNLRRKIQEAYLAMRIERSYTKDEILTFYLNRIYFGESAYGIKVAAKTYFGKDISDKNPKNQLTVAEAAMLAGLPQAPSAYDPYTNEEKAKNRRTIVLGMLKANKIITQAEYDKAKDEKFDYVKSLKDQNISPQSLNKPNGANVPYSHPWFVDYAIDELKRSGGLNQDTIFAGGLKIYTTMDSAIQTAAEQEFNNSKNFPVDAAKGEKQPVQGAMVVISPKDGSIAAMVGGREYKVARDFNRAWQAERQPGSSAKPLAVYAPALEKDKSGYFEGTVLDDMPVTYKGANGGKWTPQDSDAETQGQGGLITMKQALTNSVNIYAIKLLDEIGINYAYNFAKDQFGLPLKEEDKALSLALGTESVHVIDMASAFTAFPGGGEIHQKHAILKVVDANGTVLIDNSNVEKKRVISRETAYLMNDMLTNVVQAGTAQNAKIPGWAVAGKTGTTSLSDNQRNVGMRDVWFVGYTPEYVGAVWMGLDKADATHHLATNEYGGVKPAKLWKKVMTEALKGKPVQTTFPKPDKIVSIQFDRKSGKRPSSLTPQQFYANAYANKDNLPTGESDIWTQVPVCKDQLLKPGPGTKETIPKTVLDLANPLVKQRTETTKRWPDEELPYMPPTGTCTMGTDSDPGTQLPFPGAPKQDAKAIDNLTFTIDPQGMANISVDVGGPCTLQAVITGPNRWTQTLQPIVVAAPQPGVPIPGGQLPVKGVKYTIRVTALELTTNKVLLSLTKTAEYQ